MDVKVFRTFIEVAQTRHFGRAAENLYLTQAAVSARIKQLEQYFSTTLFVRDRNNIQLTSSGERLLPYAEIMVTTLVQAKQDLALGSGQNIQLTLAGTPSIWDAYLQQGLALITEAFEGYAFHADTLGREQVQRGLLERTLDMGLIFDPLKAAELVVHQVGHLELCLVATQAVTPEQALAERYVYVDWGTRFATEHAARHPRVPPPYLRTATGRIALDFILDKGGAAYLPRTMVEPHLLSGALFRVAEAEPWQRPIYLLHRKDAAALAAIEKVVTLLSNPAG